MVAAILSQTPSRLHLMLNTQRESLKTQQHKVRVERRWTTTEISQAIYSALYYERGITKSLVEIQSVITLRRAINLRELSICPIIVTAINDDTAHSRTVTINPLCCRIYYDICTPIKRIAEETCSTKSIINYKRHILTLGQLTECCQIGNVAGGVTHTLGKNHLGLIINQRLEILDALALGNSAIDAQLTQRDTELIICTTIQIGRCHDIITRRCQCRHRD